MDFEAFPAFKDFLLKSEPYARSEGFRFREISSFPVNLQPFLIEKQNELLSAEPDSPIRDDLRRALLLCESEAIRKVMVATCRELDLFPPNQNGLTEGIEQTAWALYTHQKSLYNDSVISSRHTRLTLTAFFIVDFAAAAGFQEATETSEGGKKLLKEFLKSAQVHKPGFRAVLRDIVLDALDGFHLRKEVSEWLDSNWDPIFVGAGAFAAGVALAALLFKRGK